MGRLERLAGSGADEAILDAFAMFPSLGQVLDFASQVTAMEPPRPAWDETPFWNPQFNQFGFNFFGLWIPL